MNRALVLAACPTLLLACGGTPAEPPATASTSPPGAPSAAPSAVHEEIDGGSNAPPPPPPAAGKWPFDKPTEEEKTAQLERLEHDNGPLRTNWTPPGRSERYGHAEGLIDADADAVRARLADFNHYDQLAGPKFKKVSLVEKSPAGSDLYFQLPILRGAVTIWYVARFPEPKPAPGDATVIEGDFVKGNIKGMHLVFRVRPVPEKRTVLTCDLLLTLNMAAPQGEVDQALRDACGDAVRSVRTRTTGKP